MAKVPNILRVLMFPGVGNANENRYIDILAKSLRANDVEVSSFHKEIEFRSADIFHVHWPELIADIRARPWQKMRAEIIKSNFFRTIARIHKKGGAVVWTVHNLSPHRVDCQFNGFNSDLMKHFVARVDGVLSLTESGVTQIKSTFPALEKARFFVTPHPHYRGAHRKPHEPGVNDLYETGKNRFVFGLLGTLRPNKKALELIQAFKAASIPDASLLIAGAATETYAGLLRAEAGSNPGISLVLRKLSEIEMQQAYAAIDALVFPAIDYFNSGTLLTALSHNVPVLAAATPANVEIQQKVGPAWINFTSPNGLEPSDLVDMIDRSRRVHSDHECDLSSFEPDYIGLKTREAYEEMLLRRSND